MSTAFTDRMTAASESALAAWGRDAQLRVVAEEATELALVVLHRLRGRATLNDVLDEVADAYVVLRHLRVIEGLSDAEVADAIARKVDRLEGRLRDRDRASDNAAIAAIHQANPSIDGSV